MLESTEIHGLGKKQGGGIIEQFHMHDKPKDRRLYCLNCIKKNQMIENSQ